VQPEVSKKVNGRIIKNMVRAKKLIPKAPSMRVNSKMGIKTVLVNIK